uniref:Uncharacterized protein n=1 Tax=Sander lucioperca TaxID=283035 RepID=A0A8C9WZD0_SANLU
MQVGQGNFFFHSNSRLGADGGLGDERQLLVEEQKLCRSRARKFFLETNRRRKALEERRKQRDVQEQRLIENILKQRRQRVQDATERFQRAHLPPSQRRRQCYPRQHPQMSCFVHNSKIFSLLSQRREETRKYSHLRSRNQRIILFFIKKNDSNRLFDN